MKKSFVSTIKISDVALQMVPIVYTLSNPNY